MMRGTRGRTATRTRARRRVWWLVACAALSACGDPTEPRDVVSPEGVAIRLEVTSRQFTVADSAIATVTLTNTIASAIELHFQSSCDAVSLSSAEEFGWGFGCFPGDVDFTLPAHGQRTWTFTVNGLDAVTGHRLTVGVVHVQGCLAPRVGDGYDKPVCSRPVTLSVTPAGAS
ncbi:MAG TPA: hypothetical protein VF041_00265 [Gemmatimonadaceae bacterium]